MEEEQCHLVCYVKCLDDTAAEDLVMERVGSRTEPDGELYADDRFPAARSLLLPVIRHEISNGTRQLARSKQAPTKKKKNLVASMVSTPNFTPPGGHHTSAAP